MLHASSLFQHWYFKAFLSFPEGCPSAQTQRKKGCAFGLPDLPSVMGEEGSSCCRTREFHLVAWAVEMQGPHAADPGEEVMGLHWMLVGLRGLDTMADILHLSLSVCPHLKKRQKKCNQIKEVSKAKCVSEAGGEAQNTFPLCILGKREKKCFLRPPETCQDICTQVKPRKISLNV